MIKILILTGLAGIILLKHYRKMYEYIAVRLFKFLAPGQQPIRDIDSYLVESNDIVGKWTFVLGNDTDYFGHNMDYNTQAEAVLAALDAIKRSLSKEFAVGCWTHLVGPGKARTYAIIDVKKYRKGRWLVCQKLANSLGSLFL